MAQVLKKAQQNFQNCFVSAPFGTDTSVLRAALERRNVRWRDATSVTPGTNWVEVIEEEMARADFICVVAPNESNPNVLFELGMAVGKKKPVLAFVQSSVGLPLESLTYFRMSPDNPEKVDRALDTFLQHSKPALRRPKRAAASKPPITRHFAHPELVGLEAEERTAELFRQTGCIVSETELSRDTGADLAVWINELESLLGGPVLVEVKSGRASLDRIVAAEHQLRRYIEKTHGKFGLLVWWNSGRASLESDVKGWPFVLKLKGEDLSDFVERGELVKELTRLRNAAVHGGV